MNPSNYGTYFQNLINLLTIWLALSCSALASPPITNIFGQYIRPLFKERCFACHGSLKQEANLRVDTTAALFLGGDSGPAIEPLLPDNSLLISRISSSDLTLRMPPEGHALTPTEINTIKQWIASGAPSPSEDHPEPPPTDHWAFRPIARPAIQSLADSPHSLTNPIDYFLATELNLHQIAPQPLADPAVRLRRLYIDLIGIPPSPQQLDQFVNNPSAESYARIAQELLNSPQHGERWARHWMDVWRYADWFGRRYVPDAWNSAPQIWHWRDWIIRSLNDDVGYDQMIHEMLAADEIQPGDPASAVATGYLIRNWYALNPNDWMRSNVEHTGKAFLGLTFQCAHCHDHKYDPITQEDYFSFRAFFESIGIRQDQLPGQPDPGPFQEYEYSTLRKVQRLGIVSIFDKNPDAKTFFYSGGDERNRDLSHPPITPNVPKFLAHFFTNPTTQQLPPQAAYPGLNPDLRKALQESLAQKIEQARTNLSTVQAQHESRLRAPEIQSAIAKLKSTEDSYLNSQGHAEEPHNSPISGDQSLLFNAITGRRMIFRSLPEVKEPFSQALISFDIAILTDAHFNFQLTRDNTQGLTATFIGFEKGEIRAYQPNSFQEFVVCKFDASTHSNSFNVEIKVDLDSDQSLLTIHTLPDREAIVSNRPIALNQWNPYNDLTKGILFDARPGALAAIDNLSIKILNNDTAATQPLLDLDFEPADCNLHSDIASNPQWQALSFCLPPADSRIVDKIPSATEITQEKELNQLRRAACRPQLELQIAEAQLIAAQTELEALLATIQADDQLAENSLTDDPSNSSHQLAFKANEMQRLADLREQEANYLNAELALTEAECQPESDVNRHNAINAAMSAWIQAQANRDKLRGCLHLPPIGNYQPLTRTYPKTSTGKRKALAEWITHTSNPLTARVAINHIWMRHFHKPLVPSVFDFGRNAPTPRQLALLNWLAAELIESDWSLKRIHYLMVTSQAFQRSSSMDHPKAQKLDPDNDLYWRMNTGRMEAEVIRDSLLQIAGTLDRQFGGQELENSLSFTSYRRSLYYCCQPEEDGKSPIGQLFDGPDPTDCYRRSRTIIPQQALALTNSPLIHQAAEKLNQQLQRQLPKDFNSKQFIELAFQSILNRSPSETEANYCLEYLSKPILPSPDTPTEQASPLFSQHISLLRVLFNHNDFITIR